MIWSLAMCAATDKDIVSTYTAGACILHFYTKRISITSAVVTSFSLFVIPSRSRWCSRFRWCIVWTACATDIVKCRPIPFEFFVTRTPHPRACKTNFFYAINLSIICTVSTVASLWVIPRSACCFRLCKP